MKTDLIVLLSLCGAAAVEPLAQAVEWLLARIG